MANGKTACIICKKEGIKGTKVKDDGILQAIRKVKSSLGIIRGFTLVVCADDLEEYRKKRQKFEKMAVIHSTVAAILVVLFIFGPLLLGAPFNPMGVFFSIVLGLMIAALALLSYVPALEGDDASSVPTPGQVVSRLMPRSLVQKKAAKAAPSAPAKKAAGKPAKKGAYKRKKK
jgi:uncharacterized membrane protein (DUF485 family)